MIPRYAFSIEYLIASGFGNITTMEENKYKLILCILVVLAGCTLPSTEVDDTKVQVEFYGTIDVQSGSFVFDGGISANTRHSSENYAFENTSIVLYDENGQELYRENVGTLSTKPPTNTRNISIEHGVVPKYMVIESPQFWEKEVPVEVTGFKKQNSTFVEFWITEEKNSPGT
jgi:hypothetical protein